MSIRTLLIALLLFVAADVKAQTTYADDLPAARRAEIAAKVYATVKTYFAHWEDVPGLDFDAAFAEALDEAMTAPDRKGFSFAMQALVAKLGNSHTGYWDNALFQGSGYGHGFMARPIEGRWVVVSSSRADLATGDEITALDDEPIDSVYARIGPRYSSSTDHHRAYRLFERSRRYLFPMTYTLSLADGRSVPVDRSERDEWEAPEFESRLLEGGRIGYIRVPSWNDPSFQARALEALKDMVGTEGLVVDVRGNGGGSSPMSFTRALMDRPWRWWKESTPMSISLYAYYAESGNGSSDFARPHMMWQAETVPADTLYTKPLVILVDEGCHSACEDFVQPFKDNGRAVIVGHTTAGSTGQPWNGRLYDGIGLGVGAKREYFPDGRRFEGVGIEPDVVLGPTAADLRAGRDAQLEKALEILRTGR